MAELKTDENQNENKKNKTKMNLQIPESLQDEKKIYFIPSLNTLSYIFGCTLIAICLCMSLCLVPDLHPSDAFYVLILFIVLALFGLYAALVGYIGRRLALAYSKPTMRPCLRFQMYVWLIAAFVCVFLALGYLLVIPSTFASLQCHLRDSMYRGMNQYLQDASWKKVYDSLQPGRQCCGVTNHTDWKQTAWISLDQIKEGSNSILDYMKVDGSIVPPVVPYSCCKPGAGGHCLHDSLQQRALFDKYKDDPDDLMDKIYTDGCFPKIATHLRRAVNASMVVIALICITEIVLLVVTIYIHAVTRAHRDAERRQPLSMQRGSQDVVVESASEQSSSRTR